MPDLSLFNFILDRILKSRPVILLCVVDSKGSSPGRRGFKMAVAEDGISGSVGGGMMEYKFVELAKEKLKDSPDLPFLKRQVHNKNAVKDQSGMICSGEQTLLLYRLSNNHAGVFHKIISCLNENKSGYIKYTPHDIRFTEDKSGPDYFFEMKNESEWMFEEKIGFKNHLYIIGGGHCALALSKLMSPMDFYITLIDERSELNTLTQNTFVQEKKIVDDYSKISELITPGANVYVVIMTFGYRTDDVALRAIINKDFYYLGVLGSKAKIEKMMADWRNDHLPEEKLKSIHAPIGLHINSQTPEEIAISIAAEIIKEKNVKR